MVINHKSMVRSMNELHEWGVIKVKTHQKYITGTFRGQPLYNKMFYDVGDGLIPVYYFLEGEEQYQYFTMLMQKYYLDVYVNVEDFEIIPPRVHPNKIIDNLLPIPIALTFKITEKKYAKLLEMNNDDLDIISLLYSYYKTAPYYHTPFQSNHTPDDFHIDIFSRVSSILRTFDPKTLRFLIYKNWVYPIFFPKRKYLQNIVNKKALDTLYNSNTLLKTPEEYGKVFEKFIKETTLTPNSILSQYFSISMFGADLVGRITEHYNVAILKLNKPFGVKWKSLPLGVLLYLKEQPVYPVKNTYHNIDLLYYGNDQVGDKVLIFGNEEGVYKYEIQKNQKVIINQDSIIITTKDKDIKILKPKNDYYNQLFIHHIKNTT